MKTVYILGAGASHGNSLPDENQKPPLTKEFLKSALKNPDIRIDGWHKDYKEILNKTFNIDEKSLESENIEVILSLAYAQRMLSDITIEEGNNNSFFKEYQNGNHIFESIAYLIHETIRYYTSFLKEKDCEFHKKLVEKLDDHDTIISFNYDLIIDFSVFRSGKIKFDVKSDYGIKFDNIFEPFRHKHVWRQLSNLNENNNPDLLKLHGSINWFFQPKSRKNQEQEKLYIVDLNDILINNLENITYIPNYNYLYQVIIPPLGEKLSFLKPEEANLWEKVWSILWKKAYESLFNCDRVIIIGYSLPELDINAHWLLRRTMAENKNAKIIIVNPCSKTIEKFESIFKGRNIKTYPKTLGEFVNSEDFDSL